MLRAAMDISAHQLEFEIRNAFQFGEEELAHFSLTVTNLAKSHVLVEDIVRELREYLVRVMGIPARNPPLRHRGIPIRGGFAVWRCRDHRQNHHGSQDGAS